MSEHKLKPCPFCGEKPKRIPTGIHHQCPWADRSTLRIHKSMISEFAKTWNRRPIEDAQAARIAELEAALRDIEAATQINRVCDNCKHCQELCNDDWCGWVHKPLEDASSQECSRFEADREYEAHKIARKALRKEATNA